MKTNLEAIKKFAITFLHIEPEPVGDFGILFITHPFTNTSTLFLPETKELFDLFEDSEKFVKWKKFMEKVINKCENAFAVFMLINTPYKLTFFKHVRRFLSKEDYGQLLIYCYTQVEFIADNINYTKKEIIEWFNAAEKQYLMDEEEMALYESLPESVTIYRGCRDEAYKYEFSWTLDKKRAIWFAKRYSTETQILLETKINKSDILCYTDMRNEKEVIINPMLLIEKNVIEEYL